MKRYILCAILVGNLACGMDNPETPNQGATMNVTEQESLLIDLEVQLHQEASGRAREVLARRIIRIRKELGRLGADLYHDIPSAEFDRIVKDLPAQSNPGMQMESSAAAVELAAPKIPIAQMNKAQIEALIQENSGMMFTPESEYMEAMEARCKELKMFPYDKRGSSVPQVTLSPTATNAALDQLSVFDEISKMSKDQLHAYEQQVIANEGAINPYLQSEIKERFETLAIIERDNALLKQEKALPERALSPKKVHFSPLVPQDSDDMPNLGDSLCDSFNGETPSLVGTDLQMELVAEGQDPLARIPTPSVQESRAAPSPAASPVPEDTSIYKSHNTESQETQGRVASPELPVEPIAPITDGSSSSQRAIKSGMPTLEDLFENKKDESQKSSISESDDSVSFSFQQDGAYNATQKFLIGAGIAAAVYTTTEVVLAYKSITPAQWENSRGILSKAKLVLNKTWKQVKTRPAQGIEALKKLIGKRTALA